MTSPDRPSFTQSEALSQRSRSSSSQPPTRRPSICSRPEVAATSSPPRCWGAYPGVVSGCALVVDYVLTVSISIASGADAIFSFLPIGWGPWKLWVCALVVMWMVLMNLRGVKESVLSLLPIFIAFIVMHVWLVGYAILSRAPELPSIVGHAVREVHASSHSLGMLAVAVIFFRAYSLGGGTYTGIEAVSNGLPILREPRAETG